MERRCFVANFSISLLDSWLADSANTSCLGMEGAGRIPLLLNEYINIYHGYEVGKHLLLSLNLFIGHWDLFS